MLLIHTKKKKGNLVDTGAEANQDVLSNRDWETAIGRLNITNQLMNAI